MNHRTLGTPGALGLAVLAALATLAPGARAAPQAPKVGAYYEDRLDLGFRIKVAKDWEFVPGNPLDPHTIGKFAPPNVATTSAGSLSRVSLNMWLLRFDRRPGRNAKGIEREIGGEKVIVSQPVRKTVVEWVRKDLGEGQAWDEQPKLFPKELRGAKVPAEYWVFTGKATTFTSAEGAADPGEIGCYAAVFHLADDLDVALVGLGPGGKKWSKFEKAFESMARTIQPLEVEARVVDALPDSASPRDRKRAELQERIATDPGWRILETENYFVLTNNEDESFLDELMVRLEAIRSVYETDYPPERARLVRVPEKAEEDRPEGAAPPPAPEDRTIAVKSMLERSRASVVRVCKDLAQYLQYGGPRGTAGYWHSLAEELVIFDDKKSGGRDDTWATLNHEAFHQYIYYFYGNLAPHPWYNEGTGDYYAGCQYKYKKFVPDEFLWRTDTIGRMLNAETYVPLEEFVRWNQAQYYGSNDLGVSRGDCYAQGWSLIWFLRTGAKNRARGWDPAWESILDTYMRVLAETGDLDTAVDQAFAGVDWKAFEGAWKDYIG